MRSTRAKGSMLLAIAAAAGGLLLAAPTAATAVVAPSRASIITTQVRSGAPSPTSDPAVTAFGSCIGGTKAADVLLLIDESGSLQHTDKRNARVTAARYLIKGLARYAESGKVRFAVSVAAFADSYRTVQGWTPLSSSTLGSLDSSLDTLKSRHDGFDTDYWTALDGARTSLEHQQNSQATHCQAILWFTDGELDVEPRTTTQQRQQYGVRKPYDGSSKITSREQATKATAAAAKDLCRSGGLADALRTDKVWTFAVGLEAGGNQGDFTLMRRVATGTASGAPGCGSITSPTPGSFQLASNIDSLLFAFDSFTAPGQPSITNSSGVCQRTACAKYAHAFVLDSSIKSVHVLGTSTKDGVNVSLRAPTGAKIELGRPDSSGSRTIGGVTTSWAWISPRSFDLNLAEPPSDKGWVGQWSLIFTDPSGSSPAAISRTEVHITSDIAAAWPAAATTKLQSGATVNNVLLGLERTDGSQLAPSSIKGSIRLSADLLDSGGKQISVVADSLSTTTITQPLSLHLAGVSPGKAALQLTLLVTTAPARLGDGRTIPGTALSPQVTSVPLTIEDPPNYPRPIRDLEYGSITGRAAKTTKLSFTGSGCAWLVPTATRSLTSPASIGTVTLSSAATSASSCIKLGVGGTSTLAVELKTAHVATGALKGTTMIALLPKDRAGPPMMVPVRFEANLSLPLNSSVFVLAFIIALLVGIGFPIVLLYVAKMIEARIPTGTLLAQRFHVEITPNGVIRDGIPLSLRDRDFVDNLTAVPKATRSILIAGTRLRAVVTGLPGTPCQVIVDEPGFLGVSSDRSVSSDKQLRARLPLAVHNHWVLLQDPAGPAEKAELLAIVAGDSSPAARAALLEDAARRVPGVLRQLRAAASEKGIVVADERRPVDAAFPGARDLSTESFPGAFPADSGGSRPPGGFGVSSPTSTDDGPPSRGTGFPQSGTGFPQSGTGFPGSGFPDAGTGFPSFPPGPGDDGGTGFPGSSR